MARSDAPRGAPTFYPAFQGASDRTALASRHRVRFVRGGGFDGGMSLVVWREPSDLDLEPRSCERPDPRSEDCLTEISLRFRAEGGTLLAWTSRLSQTLVTQRIELGPGGIVPPADFGFVDLVVEYLAACDFPPPVRIPRQSWVTATMSARGRYSIGLGTSRPHQDCFGYGY